MPHALNRIARATLAAALIVPAVAQAAAFTVIGPKQIVDPSTGLEWVSTTDPSAFAQQGFRLANTAEVMTLMANSGFSGYTSYPAAPESGRPARTIFTMQTIQYTETSATMGLKFINGNLNGGLCIDTFYNNGATCYNYALFASDTDTPHILQASHYYTNGSTQVDWYAEFQPAKEGMYSNSAISGLYKDTDGAWKTAVIRYGIKNFGVPVENMMVRAPVPEPSTWLTMLAGLSVLPLVSRRMKKRAH